SRFEMRLGSAQSATRDWGAILLPSRPMIARSRQLLKLFEQVKLRFIDSFQVDRYRSQSPQTTDRPSVRSGRDSEESAGVSKAVRGLSFTTQVFGANRRGGDWFFDRSAPGVGRRWLCSPQ